MVALKLWRASYSACCSSLKQERRGGIETQIGGLPPHLQLQKQERRGGIETLNDPPVFADQLQEAGTPWWH